MNTEQFFKDNKKIISGLVGFVVFIGACYVVYVFIQPKDTVIITNNEDLNTILKPETVALLKNIKIEKLFLENKNIKNNKISEGLEDFSEKLDVVHPKERINPFIP